MELALKENGYKVRRQELSYKHGGGFLRCLALFADISKDWETRNMSANSYVNAVKSINKYVPASMREFLHWETAIHEDTQDLIQNSHVFPMHLL